MKTIYAIPGLGTTKELFSKLKLNNCNLVVLNWPAPKNACTMKQYAKEFLGEIKDEGEFYLMGVSLGGMLCSELSHLVNAKKTILISSCKTKKELPFIIHVLKIFPIHKFLPEKTLRKLALNSNWLLGFEKEYEDEFTAMLNSMPENYVGRTIEMVVGWENERSPKNTIHIHGAADRLLTYGNVSADFTIKNGSHAMIIYQAEEISKIVNDIVSS